MTLPPCLLAAALLALSPLQAAAQTAPAADPALATVATRIADRLLPQGALGRMMQASMDGMMGSMTDQMMEMPLRDLVRAGGLSEADAEKLGPATIKQMMALLDPAYEQRTRITMKVMMDEMVGIMASLEPEYRAGLAESMAARFTTTQLIELDRFFATPTGSAYAAQSLSLYSDPAMMRRMQAITPRIMQAMPVIMKKTVEATAHLPKMRDAKSLSEEERARFLALLAPEDDTK